MTCKRPHIQPNVQNSIIAMTVQMLQGVAEYTLSKKKLSRDRKKSARRVAKGPLGKGNGTESAIDRQIDIVVTNVGVEPLLPAGQAEESIVQPPQEVPEVMGGLTLGINEVTKRLEAQCRTLRTESIQAPPHQQTEGDSAMVDMDTNHSAPRSPIRVVLVCRADVDPPLLINHIPHLVASCNSHARAPSDFVRLVTCPGGSELVLAQALGLRRACVVAFDVSLCVLFVHATTIIIPFQRRI